MNKILLAIAHYGSSNRHHLLKCLTEYNSFVHDIDVHLYLTEEITVDEFPNLSITQHVYDKSIEQLLVQEHKSLFVENQNKYDYYIYCEDDVLITKQNFETFLEVQATLPFPWICGFLRYEYKNNGTYKYLFDNHPVHSCHRGGNKIVKTILKANDEEYIEVYNIHQGCYILPNYYLVEVINNGHYLENFNYYAGGPLEGAASDVFYKCNIIKLLPKSKLKNLLIHHLPNKYVHMLPDVYTEDTTPNEEKILNEL